MNTSQDVSTLNSLISTTLDSVKGYREAAEASDNTRHQSFFRECAEERSRIAAELQDQVRKLGGEPETESSVAGAIHRSWLDLKSAIAGRDQQAIINEVERGEDYIKAKFEKALEDEDISPTTRGTLEQCFESVRRSHEHASSMKHEIV